MQKLKGSKSYTKLALSHLVSLKVFLKCLHWFMKKFNHSVQLDTLNIDCYMEFYGMTSLSGSLKYWYSYWEVVGRKKISISQTMAWWICPVVLDILESIPAVRIHPVVDTQHCITDRLFLYLTCILIVSGCQVLWAVTFCARFMRRSRVCCLWDHWLF